MDFSGAVDSFLQDTTARNLSTKTWKRYHDDLTDLMEFLTRRSLTSVEQVTTDHLRAYLANLQTRANGRHVDQHLSPYTVEGMYRSVKTFFNFCCAERHIAENPMARIRRPKLPERDVPRLSENQVAAVLDAAEKTLMPQRNLCLLMLLVDSGLRRGEALGLGLTDLDLEIGKVHVFGKGRKMRWVPLGCASSQALRDWLAQRAPVADPHLFVTDEGTPLHADGVRSLFMRLQQRVGLPRLYPHLMRHTFAQLYLERVQDVKSLQQILGHSRSSTTLDLYVRYPFDVLKRLHAQGSPVDAIKKARQSSVAPEGTPSKGPPS